MAVRKRTAAKEEAELARHRKRTAGVMAVILLSVAAVLYRHDWAFLAGVFFVLGTSAIGACG